MKNLRTPVLCTCLMLFGLFSMAQVQKIPINEPDYNKPKLFSNLPDKISFNPDGFLGLMNKQPGVAISASLSDKQQIPFEGTVVSSVTGNEGKMQSVVIKSTNYNGAIFSMSKVTNDDGSVTFNGRLISFKHGDAFVLQKTEGHYMLIKKNYYDLVNE